MKDTKQKLLKIGILIIVIIIIITVILIILLNRKANFEEQDGIPGDNNAILEEEKVQKLNGISDYFNLKTCLQSYYSSITNLRTKLTEEEQWYAELGEIDISELERSR